MPKFVKFEHCGEGQCFYVNVEYVTNVSPWGENFSMLCLMPHLAVETDIENPPGLPFVAIVEGNIDEVMHKLKNA